MGEASITGAGALSKGKVTARNLTSDAKETNGRGETEKGRRRSALIFLADVDLSAGRRPSGLSYIEIEILLFQITSTTWHAIFMYVCHLYVYAEGSLSLLLDFHDPNTWPDTRILSNIV